MLWHRLKRKTATAPPAPDGEFDHEPSTFTPAPERPTKQSLLVKVPVKVSGAIACSLVASMIINAASLKHGALAVVSGFGMACHAVNSVLGDPLGGVKDCFGLKAPGGIVLNAPGKSAEQLQAEREREQEARRRDRVELTAEADALGLSWKEDWPNEKLKVEVREGKKRKEAEEKLAREAERERKRQEAKEEAAHEKERAAEERRRAQEAKEAGQRAELVARAKAVSFGVDETLPLREMRRQVEEKEVAVAADEAFQRKHRLWEEAMEAYNDRIDNGQNAVCPRCNLRMHISPKAKGITAVICRGCRFVAARDVYRAGFNPPPPPVEPQPSEGAPGGGGMGFVSGLGGGFR